MTRQECLAWAAGIIDGEGCISLTRKTPQGRSVNPHYRLILKVTMCDKATIQRLHRILNIGTIQSQKAQQKFWTDSWVWFCNATDARQCLKLLRRFLTTKAEQADAALAYLALGLADRGGHGGSKPTSPALLRKKEQFFQKLRLLKTCNVSKDKKAKLQKGK